ncbi:MAG: signal peptidase I [Solirubrobacteraceae bacterium]
MRARHTKKLISYALGLIVLGSLWFYFAPAPLGGSTSYVVTHGVSMEPRFHTGDLALVRSQSSYRVGEIVAYQNKMLHTVVLHRIIGRDGSRYIFKGDNNNFIDFEHPAASQLIGALWLHIPGAGARLQSIRSPALVGILIAAGMLLFTGAAFTRRRRRRGRERRTGEGNTHPPTHLPQHAVSPVFGVLAIGLVALLPFVALALLAFTRAPSERRPYKIPYQQSGTFSYSADAAPGPVYAGDRAVTGDPLFTHVLNAVDLRFGYVFHTAAAHSLKGKASLSATIASSNGWQTTLALGPPAYFRGDHALATGTLDLTSLLALLHNVEATTKARGSYALTITPHVSATGVSDLVPIHATFSPEVKFTLEEAELRPAASGGSALAAAQPATSQLASSSSGSATGTRPQPMFLSLGVARLSVATARTIALAAIAVLVGAVLAILALLQPILALVRPQRRDETATIRARYGRLIVPVARVSQLPGVAVIDVADIDALVRIAEHYDRSILYEATADGDAFWVTDESGQFRYTVGAPAWAADDELVSSAWAQDGEVVEPMWADGGEADAPTWVESGELAPAWPVDREVLAPAWPVDHEVLEPVWPQGGELGAPAWAQNSQALEPDASERLVGEVYADELELGGAFAAQPVADSLITGPAADHSQAADGWAVPHDADTFVHEGVDRRRTDDDVDASRWRGTDEDVDAVRAPATASAAYFTGLEWTTNS